eukprot:scaffold2.g7439.t1
MGIAAMCWPTFARRVTARLQGKHILITGGSKGIGLALARGFVAARCAVTIVARDRAGLVTALAELQADAAAQGTPDLKLQALAADISSDKEVARAFSQAEDTAGPIDILVCNAGLSIPGLFVEQDMAAFQRQVDINYLGTVRCCKAALPGMLARGRGRVVLVSSALGVLGFAGYSSYAPSKWAVRGLGDCLRNELQGTGVSVSVAYPPDTDTPGYQQENGTKPEVRLCNEVNAALGSELFSEDKVARALVRGIARGAYHLPTPDLGQALLISSMTSISPKSLPLPLTMLLGLFVAPVLSALTWLADRAAARHNRRQAAAAAAAQASGSGSGSGPEVPRPLRDRELHAWTQMSAVPQLARSELAVLLSYLQRSHERVAAASAAREPSAGAAGSTAVDGAVPLLPARSFPQPEPCSLLRPGLRFEGLQRVCFGRHKAEEQWKVGVTLLACDHATGVVSGRMHASNLPDEAEPVTTYFEGEVVDNVSHTFSTPCWGATAASDLVHWQQLPGFSALQGEVLAHGGRAPSLAKQPYIYMRWKEQMFLERGSECRLSIAGFYYLAIHRITGEVSGRYCDPNSAPDQVLTLRLAQAPGCAGVSFADYALAGSVQKLLDALREWAQWHAHRFLPGYVPPEVTSGAVELQPDLALLGCWEDKPERPVSRQAGEEAAPKPKRGRAAASRFNLEYERGGEVPTYERATNGLLRDPSLAPRSALADEAAAGEAGGEPALGGAGQPMQRLPSNRCFNCGSYGHSLRECFREMRQEVVEENRREFASTGTRSVPRRYFLAGTANGRAGGTDASDFAGLVPGALSDGLREALGIGLLDPPPWLARMRSLGLPPAYMQPAAGPEGEGEDSPLPPGFGGTEAVEAAAGAAEDKGTQHLGDFICVSDEGQREDEIDAGSSAKRRRTSNAEEIWRGNQQLECAALFPGINAPPPLDADPARPPAAATARGKRYSVRGWPYAAAAVLVAALLSLGLNILMGAALHKPDAGVLVCPAAVAQHDPAVGRQLQQELASCSTTAHTCSQRLTAAEEALQNLQQQHAEQLAAARLPPTELQDVQQQLLSAHAVAAAFSSDYAATSERVVALEHQLRALQQQLHAAESRGKVAEARLEQQLDATEMKDQAADAASRRAASAEQQLQEAEARARAAEAASTNAAALEEQLRAARAALNNTQVACAAAAANQAAQLRLSEERGAGLAAALAAKQQHDQHGASPPAPRPPLSTLDAVNQVVTSLLRIWAVAATLAAGSLAVRLHAHHRRLSAAQAAPVEQASSPCRAQSAPAERDSPGLLLRVVAGAGRCSTDDEAAQRAGLSAHQLALSGRLSPATPQRQPRPGSGSLGSRRIARAPSSKAPSSREPSSWARRHARFTAAPTDAASSGGTPLPAEPGSPHSTTWEGHSTGLQPIPSATELERQEGAAAAAMTQGLAADTSAQHASAVSDNPLFCLPPLEEEEGDRRSLSGGLSDALRAGFAEALRASRQQSGVHPGEEVGGAGHGTAAGPQAEGSLRGEPSTGPPPLMASESSFNPLYDLRPSLPTAAVHAPPLHQLDRHQAQRVAQLEAQLAELQAQLAAFDARQAAEQEQRERWQEQLDQRARAPATALGSRKRGRDLERPERDILLEFRNGITNWAAVQASRKLAGWTECVPSTPATCKSVCTWGGVRCDIQDKYGMGDAVTSLDLACRGCLVPLQGQLPIGLAQLAHLQTLDLSNNSLSGPMPPEWGNPGSFPELVDFLVNNNQLTGPFPESWGIGPAFVSLVTMNIAGNRLSGPFPASYAVSNTSFVTLMTMNFANNQARRCWAECFYGTLPDYINGMITMDVVALQNNRFTGTLPPQWGKQGYRGERGLNNTQALVSLFLHGNLLAGTLPPEWGDPESFTTLTTLTLSDNHLSGSIPLAWGAAPSALPALQSLNLSSAGLSGPLPTWGAGLQCLKALRLEGNNLSGTVPGSWVSLAALQRVTVRPGNPELCPAVPSGAAFQLCSAGDPLCRESVASNASVCPEAEAADSGSSFPVVAVAVPLVMVGALAAALGVLLVRRRRRRRQVPHLKPLPPPTAACGNCHCTCKEQHLEGGEGSSSLKGEGHPPCTCKMQNGILSPFPVELPSPSSVVTSSGRSLPLCDASPQHTGGSSAPSELLPLGGASKQPSAHALALGYASKQGSGGQQVQPGSTLSGNVLEGYLSDWQIAPEEIAILKRHDGTDWRLGSGGFGTVYKAVRNGVQTVAVKVLSTSEDAGRMDDGEFTREIALLRACRDANVLQFAGAYIKDGHLCLVTEYLEGGSLFSNLRCGRVTWYKRGKRIALDLAKALVYLHMRKIVHLDVKSSNVLLTRDGTAKLGDLGMSRILANDYVTGVVGTLAWSAPEMLWGLRCTARADIYSFGVVLWEIVTGMTPVRGQLRDPVIPDECPGEVWDIICRCCDVNPAARPSAAELVELIYAASANPPPSARSPPVHSVTEPGTALAARAAAAGAPPPPLARQSSASHEALAASPPPPAPPWPRTESWSPPAEAPEAAAPDIPVPVRAVSVHSQSSLTSPWQQLSGNEAPSAHGERTSGSTT